MTPTRVTGIVLPDGDIIPVMSREEMEAEIAAAWRIWQTILEPGVGPAELAVREAAHYAQSMMAVRQ